jgi:cation diffusion facilitator CzcD-associated flavoprotein CzcO
LLTVTRDFGIYHHINFNEAVAEVDFSSATETWTVTTTTGKKYVANFVVNANGHYDDNTPHIPDEFKNTTFKGRLVHAFYADQDRDTFTGEHVLVIGSGATAATMVPEIYKQAKSVTLVQRSPSYVTKGDWGQFPGYTFVSKLHGRSVGFFGACVRPLFGKSV